MRSASRSFRAASGVRVAAVFAALAAAPLPVLAVPGFVFVDSFGGVLPAALGFAAGAMVLVVVGEMLPEAVRLAPRAARARLRAGALVVTDAFEAAVGAAA